MDKCGYIPVYKKAAVGPDRYQAECAPPIVGVLLLRAAVTVTTVKERKIV